MNIFFLVVAFLIPYLLGSVNFSILLSSRIYGQDIRTSGSGNAGATNMLRTYGKKIAVVTLLLDVLKGVLGVLFGVLLTYLATKYIVVAGTGTGIAVTEEVFDKIMNQKHWYSLISAFSVVFGHNYPVFFKFKGGKGVATSLGVIFTINWQIGLIVLVFAILIMAITRYVSLGSVMAAVIYVAVSLSYMIFTDCFAIPRLIFDILIAALLIFRHRNNIVRLLNGTENKLGSKKEA